MLLQLFGKDGCVAAEWLLRDYAGDVDGDTGEILLDGPRLLAAIASAYAAEQAHERGENEDDEE